MKIKQLVKIGNVLAVVQINFEPFHTKEYIFRNSKGFDKCSKNSIAKLYLSFNRKVIIFFSEIFLFYYIENKI